MRLTRTHRTSPFLFQIIPLLDIIFAILIFFILSATFVSQPGVAIDPPTSEFTVEPALRSQIISLIGSTKTQIFFRDRLVTNAQLEQLLHEKGSNPPSIIIKADRQVPYDQVMIVTNLALSRGYKVVLASSAETAKP